MIRLIFCGDRFWRNKSLIHQTMDAIRNEIGDFVVIEGEALGADTLSREVAEDILLPVEKYLASWGTYGKAAGPIRNTKMRVEGKADGVCAFHNDLSKSRGTKNMVEQSMKAGLPVWVSTNGDEALRVFIRELKKKQFFAKMNEHSCPPR